MSRGLKRPHEAVDYAELQRAYPPPPEYFDHSYKEGRDAIEARQLSRLRARALSAYRVPFFRKRWDAATIGPAVEDLLSKAQPLVKVYGT